jgi:hypothetical protein
MNGKCIAFDGQDVKGRAMTASVPPAPHRGCGTDGQCWCCIPQPSQARARSRPRSGPGSGHQAPRRQPLVERRGLCHRRQCGGVSGAATLSVHPRGRQERAARRALGRGRSGLGCPVERAGPRSPRPCPANTGPSRRPWADARWLPRVGPRPAPRSCRPARRSAQRRPEWNRPSRPGASARGNRREFEHPAGLHELLAMASVACG